MKNRRVDNVLDMIVELQDIAVLRGLEFDAYKVFNANCGIYDYVSNTVKRLYSQWDYALCQTNLTLESKLKYYKKVLSRQ